LLGALTFVKFHQTATYEALLLGALTFVKFHQTATYEALLLGALTFVKLLHSQPTMNSLNKGIFKLNEKFINKAPQE
ncbi:MAG: hypothetical protein KKG60_00635, partial [Nanoarchaeota archaeon]|nr:hypothetical protein [Nanoarchaeota archaeon]